jgi:hypothetical protein
VGIHGWRPCEEAGSSYGSILQFFPWWSQPVNATPYTRFSLPSVPVPFVHVRILQSFMPRIARPPRGREGATAPFGQQRLGDGQRRRDTERERTAPLLSSANFAPSAVNMLLHPPVEVTVLPIRVRLSVWPLKISAAIARTEHRNGFELLQHPTDRASASAPPNAPPRRCDHARIHPLLATLRLRAEILL